MVGLALHLQGLVKSPLYASDLSESAVLCSRENYRRYGCPAEVRGGSLFEPWRGMTFDVIVDDISGIAQDVAVVSPWFQGVPCDTGQDGTDLVVEILRSAPRRLAEGGRLFFPVLSLSNVDRLLQVAKETFGAVDRVGRQDWPLPAELKTHMPLLRKLHAAGIHQAGRTVWHGPVLHRSLLCRKSIGRLAERAIAVMSQITQADVIAVVEDALKMKPGTLGEETRAQEVDRWDSLGQLSILVALDKLFEGKIASVAEMAEADSVPKILDILRQRSLLGEVWPRSPSPPSRIETSDVSWKCRSRNTGRPT